MGTISDESGTFILELENLRLHNYGMVIGFKPQSQMVKVNEGDTDLMMASFFH